jgi:hypothetical protein
MIVAIVPIALEEALQEIVQSVQNVVPLLHPGNAPIAETHTKKRWITKIEKSP